MKKNVCAVCRIEFVDGEGWKGEHHFMCANKRYGWNWTVEVEVKEEKPEPNLEGRSKCE